MQTGEKARGVQVRIRIDREKCVSAGNCVVTAPTAFLLDGEQKARLIDPESVDEDTLLLAAEMCPTEAIILDSDDGERIYP
jgi:ferredoxin